MHAHPALWKYLPQKLILMPGPTYVCYQKEKFYTTMSPTLQAMNFQNLQSHSLLEKTLKMQGILKMELQGLVSSKPLSRTSTEAKKLQNELHSKIQHG